MKFGNGNMVVNFCIEDGGFEVIFPTGSFKTNDLEKSGFTDINGNKFLFQNAQYAKDSEYITGFGNGVEVEYTFLNDIIILVRCWLENTTAILHFDMLVISGTEKVKSVEWPSAISMSSGENGYTVLPVMQGILIPDKYNIEAYPVFEKKFCGREATMSWWGQTCDGKGYMSIVNTPWDAEYDYQHEPNMPTSVHISWVQSLGKLSGIRQMQMLFYENDCTYMNFCKDYRNYIKKKGELISLNEKIVKNEQLGRVIGSPVIYTQCVYWHCEPESDYFDKENNDNNDRYITFEELANELKAIKEKGIEKAYVHVDGWVTAGYDNKHPDVLPPAECAGGFEGFSYLRKSCQELNYLFALHDQYRDFYVNAPSFDEKQSVWSADNNLITWCEWPGGNQTLLCQSMAQYYIQRNYNILEENKALPEGVYLDVFSGSPPDECGNIYHPVTRKESVSLRNDCFEEISSRGLVVSSEEAIDSYISHLDLVHHSPYYYAFLELTSRPSFGIPLPLINIVYHDCIFVPWNIAINSWGIAPGESGFLHCLLNGGLPSTGTKISEDDISKIKIACCLNSKVWNCSIISHKFISDDYKKQQTYFSNGINVTVDFSDNTGIIDWGNGTYEKVKA